MPDIICEREQIQKAVCGDREALGIVLSSVQDRVFSLSLRMLGTIPDAEDAAQEILVKVMTNLSSFRMESRLSTWVFRIASNHLRSYRKGAFAQRPLSFEYYGEDIASGREKDVPDMSGGVEEELLARELKLSCTNVMLQCLDAENRCIYILGTMFRLDSRVAAEVLDLTPEAYRQRLSRARARMAAFLGEYCGLGGGTCACKQRIHYAVAAHRLDPRDLCYQTLGTCGYDALANCARAMDEVDAQSQVFAGLPAYRAPEKAAVRIRELLAQKSFAEVLHG